MAANAVSIDDMPTLLVVIPHPDDEAYAFGGTIALAANAGWHCVVHCVSAGERGKRHDGGLADAVSVATVRRAELAASCRALGADPPVIWELPDGALAGEPSHADRIVSLFLKLKPDLVLALGADGAYGHPDHIAVYRWVRQAWEASTGSRPPLLFAAFPRGLFLPQYEKCIGMMGNPPCPPPEAIGAVPAHYGLSTLSVVPEKLSAIRAHRSQIPLGANSMFPGNIIHALWRVERYSDAAGEPQIEVARLLHAIQPGGLALEDLVNIGKNSARWLKSAGIPTPADLCAVGPGEAYLRVKSLLPEKATPNLYCSLYGAIFGLRWDQMPKGELQVLRESLPR